MKKHSSKSKEFSSSNEQVDFSDSLEAKVSSAGNKKTINNSWSKKRLVVLGFFSMCVLALVIVTYAVVQNKKAAPIPTIDTTSQEYIDSVTGKNSTKADQVLAKSEASSVLKKIDGTSEIPSSDSNFKDISEATTKASLYYDSGEYDKALNIYIIADGLNGPKNYVFYERVGITATKANKKQLAIQYFQKAKAAILAEKDLEDTTISNAISNYDTRIKELSK
ncbi:MAG: tetratricopeptide repeat protein [Candidatus Saccharimonadales bacterium]